MLCGSQKCVRNEAPWKLVLLEGTETDETSKGRNCRSHSFSCSNTEVKETGVKAGLYMKRPQKGVCVHSCV